MAASTVVKNLDDGSVSLGDGTTPNAVSLTVDFDQGDLSISGLMENQREVVVYESRGVRKSLRHTSGSYPTGSLTIMLTDVTDSTDATIIDFLLRQGSYSSNVSTTASTGDVYTINITLTVEGTDLGDNADHSITFADCACTLDVSEGDPNTITINFTCYGSITMT